MTQEATSPGSVKNPEAAAKERESEPLAAQVWRQPPQMLTTALIVAGVAVAVAGIAGTAAAAIIPVGAAAGAAAGASVTILRSLWETQAISEALAAAVSAGAGAVAGGLAEMAVTVLALLVGAETQRGSVVAGAVAGAAIVLAAGAHLQWVVDKLQWIIPLVKKVIAFLKTIISLATVALTGALVLVAAKILGGETQGGSAALGGATQAESATQAGSVGSKGTTQAGSAASKGAKQAGSATSGGGAATKANGSPQTKDSPHTSKFENKEESPQTDKSPQSDESAQTGQSPQTGKSPQTGDSPQSDESPQTGESPQTDGSPQSDESPQTGESPKTDKSPQSDGSPQTRESPQTDESPQSDESPQTGESPQTDESPQSDESPQTGESPKTDKSPQSDESPQTGESPQTDESPQSDESPQTGESPKTDKSPQSDGSPQTEESPQAGESPQTDKSPQTDLIENTEDMLTKAHGSTENSIPDQMTEDSKPDDGAKDSRTAGTRTDQHSHREKTFKRLHLKVNSNNKLRAADVLQISAHSLQSHESCAEEELVKTLLQKLLMLNYRARYIKTKKTNEQHHTQQRDNDLSEDEGDLFDEMFSSDEVISTPDSIHLMDVQMAVFHCADSFLKQLMVTKLSQCQFALPLLVPDPFTQQIQFPLWTFRQINKSWKMKNTDNKIISEVQPVYKAETPMVSFFRFGSVSSSKSQLMNSLINEKHNTFFHRNCPGSSKTRVLMDGVVEIAWYCSSAKDTDKFNNCVAFCNLHGDAGANEKQLQILTDMSSVNVLLLSQLDKNDKNAQKIKTLYKKPLIILFTENGSTSCQKKKGKYTIGLKNRNQSDVSEELRIAINDCLLSSASASMFRLEDVSKYSDIRVDEEDDKECKRGREAAREMLSLLKNKHLTEIKESFLPCQGKLWHLWCQKNKEINRPQGNETEQEISEKRTEINKIREEQNKSHVSEFIKFFIKQINSHGANKMFFLTWLRIYLDEFTTADFSALHQKYDEKWSTVLKLKENNDQSEKDAQTELEKISEEFQAATFGVEHIMREIGQIYESCSSVKKNKADLQIDFSSLPSLAAEMMISGFPLELMDGDAAHVPLIWVTAVLDELIKKLGDQRVFVLSVLGIQSSGKSTMLNVMFGLQFAVSAGRCTRGAFMQLLRVSEELKQQLKFDYILVVDTEGLRALELAGRSTRHHDNELATFVVGLGNLTLINIFGENPSEMQDILQIVVQAFLRMKQVNLKPSCIFVHQNVSDITAGEKNMEGKRRLQRTLDEMTKLAAKEEVCDEESFSDVIAFDVRNDVKYFAQLWEGSPPMAPPNPNYCENIQELKETIIAKASKSKGMMLTHLRERIQDLWKALLNERFVFSFRNSLEISVYRRLETEYSKWTWSLRSTMMEIENRQQNKIENEKVNEIDERDLKREMKEKIEEVKKSMSEFFEKDTEADILIQWKSSFEIKITRLQENIVNETKRKLTDILQQRHLKREIDAQRTQHENTLLEKSKELALKLKDKANDEETLKREFDWFWKEWVKKTDINTPLTKDIDILRDVKDLICDIYQSAPVDTWKDISDIFTVQSYSDYVQLKKSIGFVAPVTNFLKTAQEKLGYSLSKEDEAHIRNLITDVSLETDKMILSFNISKLGYNNNYIQLFSDYIKARITDYEESVKYLFKNKFFGDLVFSIFKRVNKTFTDEHRLFRETNDPLLYLEKKRGEYYSIFQKYCQGATSAAIFGEIICQKLKEPIEQSVYKQTARNVADEMRSNCPSLNGNRSNLEKHILKKLAEEENFDKYKNYFFDPKDHFKSFIRDEVHQYIRDKFSVSVQPKMKQNIEDMQRKILLAADEVTKHVQINSGDVDLWLKFFTQKLSGDLIFSVKDFSGMKHDDVNDFKLLEDVIRKELPSIMSNINREFSTDTFIVKLDLNNRPDEILINHFCQCCWSQCPFCAAICTNTIKNHDGDHSVPFHRVNGLKGWHRVGTKNLCVDFCTTLVSLPGRIFTTSDQQFPYTEYRTAGGVYAEWSITPDLSELPYWKWCICRFQKELETHYNKKFQESGRIPDEWRKYTKQNAIESLNNAYK